MPCYYLYRHCYCIYHHCYTYSIDISQMTTKTYKQKQYEVIMKPQNLQKNLMLHNIKGPIFTITFNNPKRYNAFKDWMYMQMLELIQKANELEEIKFIIIRGSGGNFSSGNDLSNFSNVELMEIGDQKVVSKLFADMLGELTLKIVNSKKPIFAVVEGKAIGVGFTMLALFDRVFAVEGAQFQAPLVKLAQGPQMCASYVFPHILGRKAAEDIIIKGQTVSASYLHSHSFLQSFKTVGQAERALQAHIAELDELQWASFMNARRLFRADMVQKLTKVTQEEMDNLYERWINPDLVSHLANYMQKMRESRTKPKL